MPHDTPSQQTSMLPYHSTCKMQANPRLRFFASAPLNRRRKIVKLVSCYAFFKGWLLLSQPPSCLNNFTSLPTKQRLGTLSGGLGCFPLVPRDCPAVLTPNKQLCAFGVWYRWVHLRAPTHFSISTSQSLHC